MAKTSYEKSHSKASNFNLTLLCVLASLFFLLIWVGLSKVLNNDTLSYIVAGIGGAGTLISLGLLNAFKR